MSDLILEWLRVRLGCFYLSDLPRLYEKKRDYMTALLDSIPSNMANHEEWREIYNYLNSYRFVHIKEE